MVRRRMLWLVSIVLGGCAGDPDQVPGTAPVPSAGCFSFLLDDDHATLVHLPEGGDTPVHGLGAAEGVLRVLTPANEVWRFDAETGRLLGVDDFGVGLPLRPLGLAGLVCY